MRTEESNQIVIKGARTNNLKNISLCIPHNQFIVVTGVSGSGKSSLAFDIIAQEGQRRYFETLPTFARQFMGKLNRPDADTLEGLSPVIAIGQKTTGLNSRSTVGTMSDSYDLLRLLYARTGKANGSIKLSRSLFSFNSEQGRCATCAGIGKQEKIDLKKLVYQPELSLRDGALAPTLPNGYIMYSQVTMEVLNQVCEAEGFSVDIPWNDLTSDQQAIVLYGSEKIKVPFGKHSLESRLKWTGIKAKPREDGYYKGMVPIMSDILIRDRNANILKYVHAVTCADCQGQRLNKDALSVLVHDQSIASLTTLELNELNNWIESNTWDSVSTAIIEKISHQITILQNLGLGHLSLSRRARTLSASEAQRIRVANQIIAELSDVLYVFDEPSIGLHREENQQMIFHLKELVKRGNTVIVVEHDLETIRQADWIIDIGPKAGIFGGNLLFNGLFTDFLADQTLEKTSLTFRALHGLEDVKQSIGKTEGKEFIELNGCSQNNLKNIDVRFQVGAINVVSGKSGTGKTSLVRGTLEKLVRNQLSEDLVDSVQVDSHKNVELINKLIFVDQSPIGRTPRSNPATYLGISDHIRDVFAKLPSSKERGYTKTRFSFNTKGGRCESCHGAGKTQIGMHFLGNVDVICGECNGKRFNEQTVEIKYNGKSIADVYKLSVLEAAAFFEGEKKIVSGLSILKDLGLGYLSLGQSSTTLSGGEAQRLKIANQLQKKDSGNTLYLIIEPSIGLHHGDIHSLIALFEQIKQKGNTLVCIEQDDQLISASDWHIEMGPLTGKAGGTILHQGKPKINEKKALEVASPKSDYRQDEIILNGVETHTLKGIDVRIPKNQLTVVTGLSGSGKSTLVFDTLYAEANARFTESLSTYNRTFINQNNEAKIASAEGLGPAIALQRVKGAVSTRSTVGTLSGIYDSLRLLFARTSEQQGKDFRAQSYSFNHHLGACPNCNGIGSTLECDPEKVIIDGSKSIDNGAINNNKALNYYSDPNGQFMAVLGKVAIETGLDFDLAWNELPKKTQEIILYGAGDQEWEVEWEFITKSRSGKQLVKAKWLGLCNYIDDEFERKRLNKNIQSLEEMQREVTCTLCDGSRLKKELLEVTYRDKNIHELAQMTIVDCLGFLETKSEQESPEMRAISKVVLPGVISTLGNLIALGLGYLGVSRAMKTLSGGERQRVALAGQLSTQLYGVTYILDEPTIGLDSKHVRALIDVLRKVISNGNTVVVVEHDKGFIESADYLIELGPLAGKGGGEIMFQGARSEISKHPNTLTNKLLKSTTDQRAKKFTSPTNSFGIVGAHKNNLKDIDLALNSARITAITGVSGSGKSTLIEDVLYKSWQSKKAVGCSSIFGFAQFDEVHLINQEPFFASALNTPATYTNLMDQLKSLYSKLEEARKMGLKRADFSYQSKVGKCPTCSGYGKEKTSLDFLGDIWLPCTECDGLRYSELVLSCTMNGKSLGDVLQMTVNEATEFFIGKDIQRDLKILQEVGVGHVQLGQSGNTLSGGEGQRLKLAKTLMDKREGRKLYLFDEPSTGLHYFDVLKLIELFNNIVSNGHTIVFIEHNETLIGSANHVVSLGPGSGDQGGGYCLAQTAK
jgi:excinuclease ABC subunit A